MMKSLKWLYEFSTIFFPRKNRFLTIVHGWENICGFPEFSGEDPVYQRSKKKPEIGYTEEIKRSSFALHVSLSPGRTNCQERPCWPMDFCQRETKNMSDPLVFPAVHVPAISFLPTHNTALHAAPLRGSEWLGGQCLGLWVKHSEEMQTLVTALQTPSGRPPMSLWSCFTRRSSQPARGSLQHST